MKTKHVKARKEFYACSKCRKPILKGEDYAYYISPGRPGYYNDSYKVAWHEICTITGGY